ncbi:hypothetical protein BVIR_3046 [Blastochloris viridis]|uniref:Uncharacterized protein n=2 Tax=Blastochloris viridis TaxID=1079 RepID=A0A0H5BDR5_BLAVI|nr:hypothetical protein BVIR_3046 [Blastochloris viridis]BAR99224.1 hypothetical protein BV133_1631 [Blastochloris viridis]CUU43469.1 hypothetical protein BVIRIDIS_24900 [Blastochloris viridis]
MSLRTAIAAALVMAATPVVAETLNAHQAREFVVGRQFAFTCFDGTAGQGKIMTDGSVSGRVRLKGSDPERYVALPRDTLRVRGEAVCAALRGMVFEPCFDVIKTGNRSFRGTLAGVPGLWCDFVRGGRPGFAAAPRRASLTQASN